VQHFLAVLEFFEAGIETVRSIQGAGEMFQRLGLTLDEGLDGFERRVDGLDFCCGILGGLVRRDPHGARVIPGQVSGDVLGGLIGLIAITNGLEDIQGLLFVPPLASFANHR